MITGKKLPFRLFLIQILFVCISTTASAQASASATTTGIIILPIAISKTADLDFGNIAVNNNPGTVILTPAGVRSGTGGATLPPLTGTVTAASFTITGEGSNTYSITLPTSVTLTYNGSNHMTATNFISSPSGTGTLSGGTQVLTVGATLNVGANQATGIYISETPFPVSVNYN